MVEKNDQDSKPDGVSPGFHERPDQPELLKQLNERNGVVYAERRKRFERQLTSSTLQIALEQRESEAKPGILFNHWSFKVAVEDAARAAALVKTEQGRAGGRGNKTDALQELILNIVRSEPNIRESGLLSRLREKEYGEVIEEID